MSQTLTESELRTSLQLSPSPLTGVTEDAQEWWIGPLSLSKHHAHFRVGFGHALPKGATFFKQHFDVEGKRGWAIVFRSMGTPPLYFTGWVPSALEHEADRWISFLNDEVAKRHAGIDTRDATDAAQAGQDHEYVEELRESQRGRGPRPSKLVK